MFRQCYRLQGSNCTCVISCSIHCNIHVCTSLDVSNGFPFPQQTTLWKANSFQDRVNKLQLHCLGWGGTGVSLIKSYNVECVCNDFWPPLWFFPTTLPLRPSNPDLVQKNCISILLFRLSKKRHLMTKSQHQSHEHTRWWHPLFLVNKPQTG